MARHGIHAVSVDVPDPPSPTPDLSAVPPGEDPSAFLPDQPVHPVTVSAAPGIGQPADLGGTDDLDLPDKPPKLQGVYNQVAGMDPDQAAKVTTLARKMQAPESYVDKNLPALSKVAQAPSPADLKRIEQTLPVTTQFLSDPRNMAATHDDLPNLATHEQLVQGAHVAHTLMEAIRAGAQRSSAGLEAGGKPDLILPENAPLLHSLAASASQMFSELPDMAIGSVLGGAAGATAGAEIGAATGTFALPGIGTVGGVVGGGAIGGFLGAMSGGFGYPAARRKYFQDQYEQGTLEQSDHPLTRLAAIAQEAGTQGLVGIGAGLAGGAPGALAQRLLARGLIAKGGRVAGALTSPLTHLGGELVGMTGTQALEEGKLPTGREVLENTLLMGGMHGVGAATQTGLHAFMEMRQTALAREFYTALGDTAEGSKLRERDPEKYAEHLKKLTDGTPVKNAYVPAQVIEQYFQSKKMDPVQVMEEMGAGDSYREAKETGSPVEIPISEWASKLRAEDYQAFQHDVKFDPDSYSHNEMEARTAEAHAQTQADMQALATQIEAERQANGGVSPTEEALKNNVSEASARIRARFADQLRAANLPEAQVKAVSAMHEAAISRFAERAGIDPEVLAGRYHLTVERKTPEQVKIADRQQFDPDVLGRIGADLEQAESAKGGLTRDQEGYVTGRFGASSGLPEYAKGKGTKAQLQALLEKARSAPEKLTDAQHAKLADMYNRSGYAKPEEIAAAANEPFLQRGQPGQVAPAFYSRLERTVEQKLGNKATPDQVRALLRDMNKEEVKHSGIEEWLTGKDKIDKQELLEHLRDNQVQVQEVVHQESQTQPSMRDAKEHFSISDSDWDRMTLEEKRATQDRMIAEMPAYGGGPKFSQYTLPGGENYREVLFTLPEQGTEEAKSRFAEAEQRYKALLDQRNAATQTIIKEGGDWSQAGRLIKERGLWTDAQQAELTRAAQDREQLKEALNENKYQTNYRSSHWDEPNVLAHTRLSDRTDAEGKRVLHVEEIQSDWHQTGRQKGYKDPNGPKQRNFSEYMYEKYGKDPNLPFKIKNDFNNEESEDFQAWRKEQDAALKNAVALPDAPFKKNWHEFVLKKILRMAAEGGYDKVAWTKGAEQAERYNLSKQVDAVFATKNADGTYSVRAKRGDDTVAHETSLTKDRLPELLGKDLSEKIVAQAGEGRATKFEGVDLKVGGEGMKGFYDKILPEFLNKYTKKWGGKVGETDILTNPKYRAEELKASPPDETVRSMLREKGEAVPVHSLDITPAMRDAVLHEGQTYFQGDGEPQGRMQIRTNGTDRTFHIDLLKAANESTLPHELAHYYLEVMRDLASGPDAPEGIKEDFSKLLKHWNLSAGENIQTEHHEDFARMFEQYLGEGKAPVPELQGVFDRFRRWITSVYRSLRNLNVSLTPEVRGVFDRLLASEDAIAEAKRTTGLEDTVPADAPAEAQKRIRTMQERARDMAENALVREQMKELRAEHQEFLGKERERATAEATDAVKELPLYRATEELNAESGKKDAVKRANAILESGRTDAAFEAKAEVHGFGSGEELARAISSAAKDGSFDKEVASRVAAHMAQFADLKDSDAMRAEAIKAIHNTRMTDLLALERETYADLARKKEIGAEATRRNRIEAKLSADAAKAQARDILSRKPISEAGESRRYVTAERNAAVKAAKAAARGDWETAAEAKRQQLLSHALAAEAMKNAEEIGKANRFLSKFEKRGNDLLDMPYGFNRQIDQLLTRFGRGQPRPETLETMRAIAAHMWSEKETPGEIANRTGMRQDATGAWVPETLQDFKTRVNDEYRAISFPQSIEDTSLRAPGEMNLSELRDLKTAVEAISSVGKTYDRFLTEFIKGDIKSAAGRFRESIARNFGRSFADDQLPGSRHANKLSEMIETLTRIPGAFDRALDTILTTCHKWDGLEEGPAKDYIYRPMEAAEGRKIVRTRAAMEELDSIFAKHYKPEEFAKYKDTRINIDGRYFTKEEILCMALNWGNEGNKQRLMQGFGYNEAKMQFIMSHLGKADWDFAQGVRDHIQKYWPDIVKLEMDANGVEPQQVQATPFTNEHGTYRGGYYPIAYDFKKSADAYKNVQSKDALFKQYSTAKAMTEQGHTEARLQNVQRAVRLSLDVLRNHHEDVIHDLEFRRAVIDVSRFLNQRDVKGGIVDAVGVKGYAAVSDWLKSVAGGNSEPLGYLDKFARWFRFKTTFFNLGYRLVSTPKIAIENMVNVSSELGVSGAARAIKDYVTTPGMHEEIVGRSDFMRQRAQHLDRDMADINRKWQGTAQSGFKRNAFFIHAYLDQMSSFPLWADVYKRALADHGDERLAVNQADESVKRTFMSGGQIDQASVMRGGEKQKMLTTAYGYQSMMWNRFSLARYEVVRAATEGNPLAAAAISARAFAYQFLLPGLVGGLSSAFLRNNQATYEDEDAKRLAARLIEEGTPLKFIPVLRDVAPYAIKKAMGEHTGAIHMTPLEEAAQTLIDPAANVVGAAFGGHLDPKLTEKSLNAVSLLVGVPKQFDDVAFNFIDWMENNGEASWRDTISRRTKK